MPTDLGKALESLHHGQLVTKKLEIYEFSNMSLELMHSYFMERKNCVRVNNMTSTWKDQFRGCLQGAPLGPYYGTCFKMAYL